MVAGVHCGISIIGPFLGLDEEDYYIATAINKHLYDDFIKPTLEKLSAVDKADEQSPIDNAVEQSPIDKAGEQ